MSTKFYATGSYSKAQRNKKSRKMYEVHLIVQVRSKYADRLFLENMVLMQASANYSANIMIEFIQYLNLAHG